MINAIITLHGDIDSLRRFNKVIDALHEHFFTLADNNESPCEKGDLIEEVINSVRLGHNPSFACTEDIIFKDFEEEIRDQGVSYVLDIIEDSSNRCVSWSVKGGENVIYYNSDAAPFLLVSDIEKALADRETALSVIEGMARKAHISLGEHLPPFTVSATMQRYVARQITIQALDLSA